jgi:hypothetical protein
VNRENLSNGVHRPVSGLSVDSSITFHRANKNKPTSKHGQNSSSVDERVICRRTSTSVNNASCDVSCQSVRMPFDSVFTGSHEYRIGNVRRRTLKFAVRHSIRVQLSSRSRNCVDVIRCARLQRQRRHQPVVCLLTHSRVRRLSIKFVSVLCLFVFGLHTETHVDRSTTNVTRIRAERKRD